ncbi:alpha/beta hydrolase [Arenibacter sp. N53]|uniref:alpha/beta hydrolase n=1 Tax=Arenibacter TaxID=178469 RepID=UPI000CD47CDF|nr:MULTISPECIES: alpha/beta hydrolase [Arenibacter]MCM4149968.1 alpha/beta hydrolase [Arenibacter sp. N53]
MYLKRQVLSIVIVSTLSIFNTNAQIQELKNWLSTPTMNRVPLENISFSQIPLTKSEAASATALLLADKKTEMLDNFDQQWDNRLLSSNGLTMPFYYQIFGSEPIDGRSLFISLHGGGGAPPAVNDRQYENQKHLYDSTIKNMEGVYMALRAPTNTWDLWHQEHIDDFLNIIIQMAVIKENVNPNKIYILGYSAGGDGLFQLAPRMADRWAAASMMAGHPGDASALSLRNIPFSIHMGALDKAYKRNELAKQWGIKLDSLKSNDPEAYIHDVQVHEGLGHWMKLNDSVALHWMKKYTRNPIPEKVVWVQDNRHHNRFYWLGTPDDYIVEKGKITAEYNKSTNEIEIMDNYSDRIQLFVNDNMLDLDQPIIVKYKGNIIHNELIARTIHNIYTTLSEKGDIYLSFPSVISINENTIGK